MTIVTAEVSDITGRPDNTRWEFLTPVRVREGSVDGSIITDRVRVVQPLDGSIRVELDPGPATIKFDGNEWEVTIPEEDSSLWDIISAAVAVPPDTALAMIGSAVSAWLQENPPSGDIEVDNISDAGTVGAEVVKATTQAAARTAIGAGTSNLTIGTTGSTAKAGNWVPDAADISDATATGEAVLTGDAAVGRTALEAAPIASVSAVRTAAYAAAVNELVPADATAGGFTVTIPGAPVNGSLIWVKKIDDTANTVTVQRSGADVFNVAGGASSIQLAIPGQSVVLQYKSGIWYVLAHGTPLTALDERFVDFDSAQTLEQKTLTTPRIATILDANGNEGIQIETVTGAVSFLRVLPSATGTEVTVRPGGGGSNIALNLRSTGTSSVWMISGAAATMAEFRPVASSVNYLLFRPSVTGQPVRINAIGSDTNVSVNVIPQGAGTLQSNGVDVVLTGGALGTPASGVLTNCTGAPTLTSPKIVTSVLDTNGNTILGITATASAVNYPHLVNAAAGGVVYIRALGADTSIPIGLRPKGVEGIYLYDSSAVKVAVFIVGSGTPVNNWKFQSSSAGNALTATAEGTDSNIDVNVVPKGTGKLKAGGNEVVTYVAVPASASATGVAGQQAYDSSYHYICTATNTWMRHAIATW